MQTDLVLLLTYVCMTTLADDWPATVFQATHGHYPPSYCHFSDVLLDPVEQSFLYRSDADNHTTCFGVSDIWPFHNVPDGLLSCDETYDEGHVFTIYYWYGSSNYFHLHYDMLIPLYLAVHYNSKTRDDSRQRLVFMPTVESTRLNPLDWHTKAFENPSKFWVQTSQMISIPYAYVPLDESLLKSGKKICFKKIHFGTPSVQYSDSELIKGFVRHVQKILNITLRPFEEDRIGIISRSNRRRILNEAELISALNQIAFTEKIEFSGMSFRDQVALMQQYTVLIGVNGAGLTNGLYLPPHGVSVQIVPYEASVNFREFGVLLASRGPYLVWHNTHEDLTRVQPGQKHNNSPDTVVHIEEFKKVVQEALALSRKWRDADASAREDL